MSGPSLREMSGSTEPKFGHFIVEFATPGIGHILKNAGCDFVLFDCEHSGFGFETVKAAIRYFEAARLPTIVRVPSREYQHIARALDMGAEGIMLPMVSTPEEARFIVDSVKYVPKGNRGVALGIAHDAYKGGEVLAKLAAQNERSAVFAQIETKEGVANADAIAGTDGIDCLWVGHFDLSCSLGEPGQFQSKTFLDAIETVAQACRKHGKRLGRLVPDVATGVEYRGKGFDFLCYSGDVWTYQAALKAGIDGLRAGCAEATKGGK
ncbi:MAG TPA: aldolase/citrate lyase family protein [Geminicoccus sp.]|uniref:HpcH/HpaI aldolase family protein n=1 Tax=Geminicoccus sp. TaxID=2024832 RepID=UPI002E34F4D9|nr:aldolase/citrate lyase family protein [Geminicoccus sp.]HEX2528316.1 aldolase/citrate lyase family protein [Geminicoccus sp.]